LRRIIPPAALLLALTAWNLPAAEPGSTPLFNGKDLTGWKIPAGDNGHWRVVNGVIDYDARSESKARDKSLWTDKSYKDFVLHVEWRMKTDEPGFINKNAEDIAPDGSVKGHITLEDVDSGIYLRGSEKSQVNIWMWPVGSGEVYGYRKDPKLSTAIHAGVTPKKKADKPRGQWNAFDITMKGDRLTVVLNGEEVISNAQLPGVPAEGPIGLQHHGGFKDGKPAGPPSLVQFRNIFIRELK
jgi:hypothetical protein